MALEQLGVRATRQGWASVIAYYLHARSRRDLDRALPLIEALGPDAHVLATVPAPAGVGAHWTAVPGHSAPADDLITAWLADRRPDVLVQDAPMAVPDAVLDDLSARPRTIVVARPAGGDSGHLGTTYGEADLVVAPWPEQALGSWPTAWAEHTLAVGALSRIARRAALRTDRQPRSHPARCVFVSGRGAAPHPRERFAMIRSTPHWIWDFAGEHEFDEPGTIWQRLTKASVFVCPPDEQSLAVAAHLRVPTLVVLPPRLSCAQEEAVAAVEATAAATIVPTWPDPGSWQDLLDETVELGNAIWAGWVADEAVARFARIANVLAGTGAGPAADTVRSVRDPQALPRRAIRRSPDRVLHPDARP